MVPIVRDAAYLTTKDCVRIAQVTNRCMKMNWFRRSKQAGQTKIKANPPPATVSGGDKT